MEVRPERKASVEQACRCWPCWTVMVQVAGMKWGGVVASDSGEGVGDDELRQDDVAGDEEDVDRKDSGPWDGSHQGRGVGGRSSCFRSLLVAEGARSSTGGQGKAVANHGLEGRSQQKGTSSEWVSAAKRTFRDRTGSSTSAMCALVLEERTMRSGWVRSGSYSSMFWVSKRLELSGRVAAIRSFFPGSVVKWKAMCRRLGARCRHRQGKVARKPPAITDASHWAIEDGGEREGEGGGGRGVSGGLCR